VTSRPRWSRLFSATIIAPFGGALGVSICAILFAAVTGDVFFMTLAIIPLFALAYAATVGLALSAVSAGPLHMLLSALGQRDALAYALTGAICGALLSAALQQQQLWLPISTVAGAFWMGTFWLIRRPDRDAANPPTSAP
jgi:hypothetical protein